MIDKYFKLLLAERNDEAQSLLGQLSSEEQEELQREFPLYVVRYEVESLIAGKTTLQAIEKDLDGFTSLEARWLRSEFHLAFRDAKKRLDPDSAECARAWDGYVYFASKFKLVDLHVKAILGLLAEGKTEYRDDDGAPLYRINAVLDALGVGGSESAVVH